MHVASKFEVSTNEPRTLPVVSSLTVYVIAYPLVLYPHLGRLLRRSRCRLRASSRSCIHWELQRWHRGACR